jgi:hypothetical protein
MKKKFALPNLKATFSTNKVLPGLFKSQSLPADATSPLKETPNIEDHSQAHADDHPGGVTCPVIFKGTHNFWRVKCTLEITIIDYSEFGCIEVVAFHAKTSHEGPRIYINSHMLLKSMDEKELQEKAADEKETCIRTRRAFVWENLLASARQNFIIQYILARINMTMAPEGKEFDIFLNHLVSDSLHPITGKLDTLCVKPDDVIPYSHQRRKSVAFNELDEPLQSSSDRPVSTGGKQINTVQKLMTDARNALGLSNKGQDDSFTFLSSSSSSSSSGKTRRSSHRRVSIDDSYVMENTNSISNMNTSIITSQDLCAAKDKALAEAEKQARFLDKTSPNTPEPSPKGKTLTRHNSHHHGLKFVHSWGSMNKMNETLVEENRKMKKAPLIKPGGTSPVNHKNVVDSDDYTDDEARQPRAIRSPTKTLQRKKSSKRMLIRSESKQKLQLKIVKKISFKQTNEKQLQQHKSINASLSKTFTSSSSMDEALDPIFGNRPYRVKFANTPGLVPEATADDEFK